jgi:NADH-quinone oxidoreductase subunit I
MTSEPLSRRGVIALIPDACTSCMLCVKECPTWCIELDSHPEQIEEPGARPRTVNVLDDFRIDYGLCMYCGICIEVCPFDALEWKPDYDYASSSRSELSQDAQRLSSWLEGTVNGS